MWSRTSWASPTSRTRRRRPTRSEHPLRALRGRSARRCSSRRWSTSWGRRDRRKRSRDRPRHRRGALTCSVLGSSPQRYSIAEPDADASDGERRGRPRCAMQRSSARNAFFLWFFPAAGGPLRCQRQCATAVLNSRSQIHPVTADQQLGQPPLVRRRSGAGQPPSLDLTVTEKGRALAPAAFPTSRCPAFHFGPVHSIPFLPSFHSFLDHGFPTMSRRACVVIRAATATPLRAWGCGRYQLWRSSAALLPRWPTAG